MRRTSLLRALRSIEPEEVVEELDALVGPDAARIVRLFLSSMLFGSLKASGRSSAYSLRHIKQLAICPTNSQPNCSYVGL